MLAPAPAHAVQPDEILADPALEARARAIGLEMRCPVCRNQSIDDSNAELARDLRVLIRERLVAGDSDREVTDYLVARYGAFILLRPQFEPYTIALWLAPLAMLFAAFAGFSVLWRRRVAPVPEPDDLSDEERAVLRRVYDGEGAP
ncbi:cytochrome c-type biogenesis protein [Jannaschia sp. KMU-145]|uniref:cytochrome c-type biogenesis protein n=1 Tax=Jannaschia halovivens TaxID=3388667 RepID=UPI00396B306B